MPRVMPLKARELIEILESRGFRLVRVTGSHRIYRHLDGRLTSIPEKSARDIAPLIVKRIMRDAKLSGDDLLHLPPTDPAS